MENRVEIIQINISGTDMPGMTSSLTAILARYDAFILDIGQANIHSSLTLGILIKTTADKSGFIMKELLFKASELGVMIRFKPVDEEDYSNWVNRQGRNRYIVTLLGRKVTAQHIAAVKRQNSTRPYTRSSSAVPEAWPRELPCQSNIRSMAARREKLTPPQPRALTDRAVPSPK